MNNFDDLLNNTPAEGQGGAQLSKEDYAAKKQAERDAVFELSDNTALEVASNGDTFQQYLDVQSTFDRYSAVNALLIMAQNHEATRVGDFDYWKQKGGYVNKGETGITILEPHPYTKEDGTQGTGYNLKKVFDISQVDTRKMGTPAPAPTYTDRQLLQALIFKAPVKITGVENLSGNLGAYTNPDTGEIFVRKGMEFADTFRCVAQELCYAEVKKNGDNTIDPMFTAFCGAYMLCNKYGVDTKAFNFDSSSALFRGYTPENIKQALSSIRNAPENISGRMARQLEAVNRAAKSQDAR